ncbi:MAG: hypothetical protein ACQCN4_08340 [Candidatus Bathyarchaeia archaeon]|jgi:hypothetical protein
MKKIVVMLAAVLLLIIVVVGVVVVTNGFFTTKDPFYVGVTYGGSSVQDAELLIDKVKDYTNLFILQGPLQHNNSAIDVIGNYAVNSDMNFMVYLGMNSIPLGTNWLASYDGRWGDSFLGVYAIDEPGGKMLDGQTSLIEKSTGTWWTKNADGSIYGYNQKFGCTLTYMQNGTVKMENRDNTLPFYDLFYYPNGTTAGGSRDKYFNYTISVLRDTSNLKYTYDELWNAYPIQRPEVAEQYYTDFVSFEVNQTRHFQNTTLNVITADYGLHWYDYQSGYDAILGEFCWNESVTQTIASVRGAANSYGKDWGVIITWKYTQTPYLASGDEIYEQMRTAYENGAKYIVIFNYAKDMNGPYGTLQDEHFAALQRFWTDVNSQNIKHEEVKADVAFMLPSGYGSGLRRQDDVVWGLWAANETDNQIWLNLQNALSKYGEKLNIVYEDSAFPVAGKYSQVIYWNQTG